MVSGARPAPWWRRRDRQACAVDGAQVRRWAARGLLLWLVAVAVWGLSVVMADLSQDRLAYALGLTLLTVGALAATRLLGSRGGR